MNIITKFGFVIYDFYRYFFDLKFNPLRHIPNELVQFILMFYLSVMWSVVFTLWAGYTWMYGIYSVGGHLLVLGAFFITVAIFHDAEKNGHLWVQRRKIPDVKDRRGVWDLENEG
tara:strand:- start:568 stop:912 length:345 start_codon:yes stop_codon:yes gene_type:complete